MRASMTTALCFSLLMSNAVSIDAQTRRPNRDTSSSSGSERESRQLVFYRNCAEVRAAGAAPIYRGQPGYAPHLDRDNDGVACEPYRGRR